MIKLCECLGGIYPENLELFPVEFLDVVKVLNKSAEGKYPPRGWEDGTAPIVPAKNNDSMFHHLAKLTAGIELDDESGLDHHLHLACRALMAYTLRKRAKEKLIG